MNKHNINKKIFYSLNCLKVQLKDISDYHYVSVIYTIYNCFKVGLENILDHPYVYFVKSNCS